MYLWVLSNPDLTSQLLAARAARAQVTSRAGYLVVTAVARAADFAAKAVIGGARRLGAVVRQARRRRQAIATLQALDDRLLSDIGVNRGEIPGLVDGALERGPASAAELRGLRRPDRVVKPSRPVPPAAPPRKPARDLPEAA